ncbi:MAG: hypothetical protein ACI9WU_001291 [Myxococcota bacterium]|jgi:hypothetical protein
MPRCLWRRLRTGLSGDCACSGYGPSASAGALACSGLRLTTVRTDVREPLDGSPGHRATNVTKVTFPSGLSPANSMHLPAGRAKYRASAAPRTLPWPLRAAAPRPGRSLRLLPPPLAAKSVGLDLRVFWRDWKLASRQARPGPQHSGPRFLPSPHLLRGLAASRSRHRWRPCPPGASKRLR